ncbi:TolC family protein [Vampirovibrio sp.]|uniref:TolC family protein n=1 Tax=Vampirovibrio sp. TaxID=2717857 RepID=UPI0035933E2E
MLKIVPHAMILALTLNAFTPWATAQEAPVSAATQEIAGEASPKGVEIRPIELRASVFKTNHYPVDLAAVLKLVQEQNLMIAQSQKGAEIFQSRYRQQQAALLPNITGTYSQNRQGGQQGFISGSSGGFIAANGAGGRTSGGGGGGGGGGRTNRQSFTQVQLSASWTLHPGGRNIYQILAAKRRQLSSSFTLKETYQEQLSQAAQEYYKLLAAYEQKGVVLRNLENAVEQVKINQTKVQIGKGIPLDLSQAKTTYAQQQSALIQAEATILQAEQGLINRLNLEPTIHLIPSGTDAQQKALVAEVVSMEQLLKRASETNPTLKVVEEELKALDYDYKMTRSDLIPSITLQTSARANGSELDNLQRSTSGGISVTANLLQNMGLQIPLQMREKKQLIEQKKLAQQMVVRNIESQVSIAFLNSENYESAIEAARQAVDSAQESYDLASGRFKAGYGINLDVLAAQTNLASAQSNLVQAVLNYNQSQIQLVQAMGLITPEAILQGIQWQGSSANAHTSSKL